jgi:hypothetical protein
MATENQTIADIDIPLHYIDANKHKTVFCTSRMRGKIEPLDGVVNTEFTRHVKTAVKPENPLALDDYWKQSRQFRFPVLDEAPGMDLRLLTRREFALLPFHNVTSVKWYPKNEFSEEFLFVSMKTETDSHFLMHLYMYLEEHTALELVRPVE